ncbi:peptide ligase PGM1-related protein [Paraburkholderia agricolaris]|uniref:Peptide ligase PGM1-related protein n=1 Tax=Paraburkholderia agricolaris TaxID=2152888 RepID=A0ABW9A1G0_9BURK
MSKIIFGNFVNQLMTEVPGPAHVKALTAPSPRKIWYAKEGDLVVIPREMDSFFKQYACHVIGLNPDNVEVLCPTGALETYLASRISTDRAAYDKLLVFKQKNPKTEVDVFAQDVITIDLFRKLAIPIYPYEGTPSASAQQLVSRINTKSGFKEIAASLEIRTVLGSTVVGVGKAQDCARKLLQEYGPLVMKIDRGSNGYGHVIINSSTDLEAIPSSLAKFSEQPDRYTIEKRMQFKSLPSIEYFINNDGPTKTYECSMRCINNAWTGMITPPDDLSVTTSDVMNGWGERLGAYLFHEGFRGTVDIDCGIDADGTIYATESNCRKTGGSYLHSLLSRLKGPNYLNTTTWLADSRLGKKSLSFAEGINAIEKAEIAWNADRGDGVILTADTRGIDEKWRYLVIGSSTSHALDTEQRLLALLGA